MLESFYQILMAKDSRKLTWIVGEGGLLGSALRSQIGNHSESYCHWHPTIPLSWNESEKIQIQFKRIILDFKSQISTFPEWTILWAAGAGVIGSSPDALKKETETFSIFLTELENILGQDLAQGHFFLGSSAGGIWGGSEELPITEGLPPCPISEYGKQKLNQEKLLIELATSYPKFKTMIGRISNLYGTSQNLDKPQGLLSQICRSTLFRVPLTVFVPLETVRDYIFNEDCAQLIYRALKQQSSTENQSMITTKIFASEEPTSIRIILKHLYRLTKREPMIICPNQAMTHQQPAELSFISKTLVDSYRCKPLIEGLKLILEFQESLLQRGELPYPEVNLNR
ncbi:MAG: NAD-dependent epimerase/dehydratase family protein [Proteobacteria bacterium]|nr:NAD-dependent epimerase/dehydratase family protein [Pseudomonadota bacterium]NBY19921.1 NAD-dependent epimerase/dehydratase family protein [bacterium]